MKNSPIGVFDSGIGGLTVLEKMYELMPNEEYIYLADHANCPYGVKKEEEIRKIVVNNVKYLESLGVKCIVVACNTASLFIDDMQKNVKIPVISVIEPTCKKACNESKNGKIAVIATQMTIKNKKYQLYIENENKLSFGVACSEFVDFIENDFEDFIKGQTLVNEKISCLKETGIDTLIHGCTHFSLLEDKIRKVLGDINYVDCGTPTSIYLKELLEEKGLLTDKKEGKIKIYTTGKLKDLNKNINLFNISYEKLEEIKNR